MQKKSTTRFSDITDKTGAVEKRMEPITYYVIHMATDDSRVNNIRVNQTKLGHPIKNFDAVVGKNLDLKNLTSFDLDLEDNFTNARGSKYKSIGEVGCYLSHFALIKSIAESGDKMGYTVVFEDDFTILIDDLQTKIYESIDAIERSRKNFDILYLGNLRRKHGQGETNYADNLVNDIFYPDTTKPIWGTHAYLFPNAQARKLYSKLINMNGAIDNKFTELVQHYEIDAFLLTPTVVDQDTSFVSSITVPTSDAAKRDFAQNTGTGTGRDTGRGFERKPYVKLTNKELQEKFNSTIVHYLASNPHLPNAEHETPELEVKFGTRGVKRITKTDYDNVVKKLLSLGFESKIVSGEHLLRMENQILDPASGRFKMSRVRVELVGLQNVQTYCKTGTIESVWYNINMYTKNEAFVKNTKIDNVEFDEFNFNLTYKIEKGVSKRGKLGQDIIDSWDNSKKLFRYINRVTYVKEGLPFKIDMSIVKSSTREGRNYKLATTMAEAGLFTNPESYEIEIEVDNDKLNKYPLSFDMMTPQFLQGALRKTIKYVLSGLQETSYPVSYTEQTDVIRSYISLIYGTKPTNIEPHYEKKPDSRDFVGPSPVTLLMKNISPLNKNSNAINIRNGYVVTEKADGSRALLYISSTGKVYLITGAMKVIFTGAKTEEKLLFNTLLDGELILHDKHKIFLNAYAAFDVYYVNKEDVRHHYFIASEKEDVSKSRYSILSNIVAALNLIPVTEGEFASPLKVICKRFLPLSQDTSIFDACNNILTNMEEGMFEYETDGLIFTPIGLGVGSYDKGTAGKVGRISWEAAFKWKPPQYNTIDFLVSTIKTPSGIDKIGTIYESGTNTSIHSHNNQHKSLILRCGVDERNDIYLNPCQDIIDDKMPEFIENPKNAYHPKQFYPTTPYDPNAGICNILLQKDAYGDNQMMTREGDAFGDNMIVEFSYDVDTLNKDNIWRWIPLRVRHDKTGNLRNGEREYGNSYRTANSNWESIHNPISQDMLITGENIPEEVVDDDVYYNSTTSATTTQALRDFHNLFVKKMLIMAVGKYGDTLIDFACGRAGDLPKWVARNLSFVFGIDVAQQNLENKTNGACARYLNYRKQYKQVPYALFAHGTSALNIRSGEAMYSEKGSEITRAIFGQGEKNVGRLGKGVIRQYAKGATGFNVSSCQFAIHYFFESKETFFNFIRNVAECTKINGYFIGTSYDGEALFDRLRGVQTGEGISIYASEEKKMWEVTKEYSHERFDAEDTCLGYKINVFQESINKSFHEFLVNYSYLNRIMADYGFRLVGKNEARSLGFNDGTGMFYELFNSMMSEIGKDTSKAAEYKDAPNMTANEKSISFLNRYFIYKKVSGENVEKLTAMFLHKDADELVNEDIETRALVEATEAIETSATALALEPEPKPRALKKPTVKKLGKKLAIVAATETVSSVVLDDADEVAGVQVTEELGKSLTTAEILDIPNRIKGRYDETTVLAFYSKSSDHPFPGSGASEKMKEGRQQEFKPLDEILQWRKKLSNFWIAPFTLDGHMWNSVEHYYQASKFKLENPDFYIQFSLDSDTPLSKDPLMSKQAGGKDAKHKYRSKNIQMDKNFFATRHLEEMFRAQYAKFTQHDYLRELLLATKDATLLHIVGRGKPNIIFDGLMYIRMLVNGSD